VESDIPTQLTPSEMGLTLSTSNTKWGTPPSPRRPSIWPLTTQVAAWRTWNTPPATPSSLWAVQEFKMGIAQLLGITDFHVEAIDLLANHIACEAGIGLVVAIYSALKKQSTLPALLVLGDLSIQGNLKPVRSLIEPLQVGMDNGARRALIPIENKRHFLDVPADIVERVDPVFYGEPLTAAMKALAMN